jgi:hypothetical protein
MREFIALFALAISVLAFLVVSFGLAQRGFSTHDLKYSHLTMRDAAYCEEDAWSSYADMLCPF